MHDYMKHITLVLSGNKNAFTEIMAMFQDMARAIALDRTGDPHLAEDAMQEAFLAAFIKLPLLRQTEAFPGWFRTILARCCDRVRSRHMRAVPYSALSAADLSTGDESDPCTLCTRFMDRGLVRRILASMSGVSREACVQRYVYGRPYRDIADQLGVPQGTIKRRLHQARRKIAAGFTSHRRPGIRVGHLPISDHLLLMAAHHRHDNADFDITPRRFLSWSSLVRELKTDMLDAAFIMAPLAMALYSKGLDIRYMLDGHHEGSAITVRTSASNKAITPPTTIALPHAVSTHGLLLRTLLAQNDASEKEPAVSTKVVSPSYVSSSMARQEIDGFMCSEPWNTRAVAEGQGRILARSRDLMPGHICCVLVVKNDFAERQPEVLHHFLRAIKTAGRKIDAHPDYGADIQARYTGVDRDVARHVLSKRHITFTELDPDKGRAEQVLRLALDAGVLKNPCDLNTFMETRVA